MDHEKGYPVHIEWRADSYWRNRRLSPSQLQVHDVVLEASKSDGGTILDMNEVPSSTLLSDLEHRDRLVESIEWEDVTKSRNEQKILSSLAEEYGWMNSLRGKGVQTSVHDPSDFRKCRWIHISSKFPEYLKGCFVAMSDWTKNPAENIAALHQLEYCINQNERFSKHGRLFTPFFQVLSDGYGHDTSVEENRPMLLSVPFLDWTVEGETPPLRFQIDPREGYQSSRSSSHLIRSILQHYYRLEDTADREAMQVFTKHKPWQTDRALDLKVRRWYGHYPTSLNVDELWILVIDARHVVTFSSNQSWKSRWPPLQVSARISDVSFRGIRNSFLNSSKEQDYTSYTHIITALSGALGLLHRSFWTDISLCITDRYASYLGHLQYRLHRSPSTKLVMDLLQVQEELNIVLQIMDQQIELVTTVQEALMTGRSRGHSWGSAKHHRHRHTMSNSMPPEQATYRQLSFSQLSDPAAQLLENLQRERDDLCDLRENSNTLINRTIQLVNIRLEVHGKAIMVFTIVTIVFLPLSFVTSFFGMNFKDIRDMDQTQSLFWIVAAALTTGTVGLATLLAFYGTTILDKFTSWRDQRYRRNRYRHSVKYSSAKVDLTMGKYPAQQPRSTTFEVLGSSFRPSRNAGF
ncbi:hypothetical protein GQ43DRAFT_248307 [Delitschia confertaspora ATCC 74209]|uniref:CorA-like protein n=1 Tax=Delitschia confertaspora ATCC 74209 TaxID=1513339 RepID=A0A9P4JEZ1_9PLEO|nr:hypothetical protein GQ43DRAFT_248307 [Delitschia confertaspora ATCC 74209]